MAANGAAFGSRRAPLKDKREGSNSKRGGVQQPKYRCVVKIALESGSRALKGKSEGSNSQIAARSLKHKRKGYGSQRGGVREQKMEMLHPKIAK